MSAKIAADHLARGAVVYVRQSTMTQVIGNLESQRRQYALADAARAAGFVSVTVIDDDLGRSGSGLAARPGFQAAGDQGVIGGGDADEVFQAFAAGGERADFKLLHREADVLVIEPNTIEAALNA